MDPFEFVDVRYFATCSNCTALVRISGGSFLDLHMRPVCAAWYCLTVAVCFCNVSEPYGSKQQSMLLGYCDVMLIFRCLLHIMM